MRIKNTEMLDWLKSTPDEVISRTGTTRGYHHMPGRLATREVYGWSMANRVKLILRHKEYAQ
ncbi:hypothetical protein PS689_03384 [Pseudomonas fluorescens]|nr:hypothetical protein PS689_03384 [Pseudomonas fluorescens]